MLGGTMFCHSCGAKNPDDSRFCNMCGTPFVRAENPLESTQLGVGNAFAAAAREAVEQERQRESAAGAGTVAEVSVSPVRTLQQGSATSVNATAETMLSPSPLPPPPSDVRPHLSNPSRDVLRPPPTGFGDPSVSIRLDAIGIQSTRRTWAALVGGGLLLLALGIGITYVAMRSDEPQGTAHEGDPFEIGAPTPDVDFVSGSADPQRPSHPTAGPAAASTDAGTTTGTSTPTTGAPASARSPSTAPAARVEAGPRTTSTSMAPPAPAASVPASPQPPVASTPPPSVPTAETPSSSPELELEMYSARVRYLVRRYHASRAQSCFDQATAENPSLSGQVVVGFHVGADGRVTAARVARNTTGNDALGSCLARQAERWELSPPPNGEVDLSMPFSR